MAFRPFSHWIRNFTTSLSHPSPRSKLQPNHTSPFFTRAKRFGNYEVLVPASIRPTLAALIPHRNVPEHVQCPDYAKMGEPTEWASEVYINDVDDAEGMRRACGLARQILVLAGDLSKPGTTTDEIDRVLHDAIVDANAYPSPLNYMGFPKSVCTSVNNVIAHGIPDQRPLKSGDILNVDITVYLDGYHGDTSATFLVGDVDSQGRDIVECTREALWNAIGVCGPGVELKEIGRTISHYAKMHNFSISEELTGHGISKTFHALPLIYHHENFEEGIMQPGMIFTIEPILCQGSAIGVMWPDRWTIVTADGGRSAQFEHTVLITEDGVEVLTQ